MKKKNILDSKSTSIDEIVTGLKTDNIPVDDFMFFELVNIAGLSPDDCKKLSPEEENRRWDLLFSLPKEYFPT